MSKPLSSSSCEGDAASPGCCPSWRRASGQRDRQEFERRFARVTPREHQVVELVVNGLTSKKIAARFGLSPKTVDVHRAEVMTKMDAHSIAELTRMVVTGRVAVDEA